MGEEDGISASGYLSHLRLSQLVFVSPGQIGAEVDDDLGFVSFDDCDASANLVRTVKGDYHLILLPGKNEWKLLH